MDQINKLKVYLETEKDKLKVSIEKEKQIRDSSPSAMQSHHDTTRNQTDKLIQALETQLSNLENALKVIPNIKKPGQKSIIGLWSVAQISIGSNNLTIMLVPEGLGGKKLEDFQTVAKDSPLGLIIRGMSVNNKFTINEKEGKVIEVY